VNRGDKRPAKTPALLSIHDVMPETLDRVEAMLAFCARREIRQVTLLVVPGRRWQPAQLARLRRLASRGYTMAAHGWHHRVAQFGGLYHRLHGALLSRRAGEHLALDGAGIVNLMHRSHAWFNVNGLPPPSLYVPPAWALGRLPDGAGQALPFAQVEVLRGIVNPATGRLHRLPLLGFEADSPWRAGSLRVWNFCQLRLAHHTQSPVRIGLHPYDFELRLGDSVKRLLQQPFRYLGYGEALAIAVTGVGKDAERGGLGG